MDAREHQDFKKEKERLEFTKNYIEIVLEAAEKSKSDYQGNIKQALVDLDYLDSSLSYVNVLANANMLQTTEKDLRNLRSIQNRPYFARIDFTPKDQSQEEKLYIGKTSLYKKDTREPVIVDWRSPIANVYYEGQLGDVSYEANGETLEGELSLKRQYVIEDNQLEEIRDIDLTARDQILQESLTTSASNRLKEIVSTIQAEQNRIIRADMDKPLIVQGVAGSGKTTIALHRMAYFIYTYAENFDPQQLMILAPNRLFLDYISDVLPELGVDQVTQTTFTDYVQGALGQSLNFISKDQKLIQLIENEESRELQWVSHFKGSLDFYHLLTEYMEYLIQDWIPSEDMKLERYTVFSAKKMKQLFFEEYTYLPPFKRLEKLKEMVKKQVKSKTTEIIEKVEEVYDRQIDKARYGIRDEEKRSQKTVALWDRKEAHVKKLEKEAKKLVPTFVRKMPKGDAFLYYQRLITQPKVVQQVAKNYLNKEEQKVFLEWNKQNKQEGKLDLEDAAPILYIQQAIYGIEKKWMFKNVFIDEAQDYSLFEFEVLKKACGTSLFTILGDLSQGIHSYRGINNWEDVTEYIFPKATYLTLKQSYRSTVEIMEVANKLMQLQPYKGMILAEPVVRHDKAPEAMAYSDSKGAITKIIQQIHEMKGENYQSFAIIGKTTEDCERIYRSIEELDPKLEAALLKEDEENYHHDVVIVPSYLSKGLEFDVVFIMTMDKAFEETELDIKLLYVAMTRGLHRLNVYYDQMYPGIMKKIF
ncbi:MULTISPECIES: RNA polymerase recycling motor HelD [Bacillaceae]|uniref:AAA family ATPase n=1 Tax=Evansella alkalicola TaxID=745819 RepID=A0ABS6K254_9BACI|nr:MULTISPECIES: RNA polymerase recycling motor HelD [Bacillaceae]MBU9723660.1 AAA family ATPase [Bacillus alkalicola]